MPKPKLPPAKDFEAREVSDWNVTTFHAWIAATCEKKYGIPKYIPFKNWAAEKGMIKRMTQEHGNETVKAFFESCLAHYKPSSIYTHLTFGFAYSYMQQTHLAPLLKRQAAPAPAAAPPVMTNNELTDWF